MSGGDRIGFSALHGESEKLCPKVGNETTAYMSEAGYILNSEKKVPGTGHSRRFPTLPSNLFSEKGRQTGEGSGF